MLFRILIIGCLISNLAYSQSGQELSKKADSLYEAKAYSQAAEFYRKSAELGWLGSLKTGGYLNAACSYSLSKNYDLAFACLDSCIVNGFKPKDRLEKIQNLEPLKSDKRWKQLLAKIKSSNSTNPMRAEIVTSDIDLFYKVFELAIKDSINAVQIFKEQYFKKGSIGLQDFFGLKIGDERKFVTYVFQNKAFLYSIKQTLLNTKSFKTIIQNNFKKFKKIYPDAVFSNVYFVIGRETANGTVSGNGLLIGAEVMSKTEDNSANWSEAKMKWILNFSQIPITVGHEIVHFNQEQMKDEKTLLKYALIEGSAELIDELVTGSGDCGGFVEFKGRELAIWQDFKIDMYKDTYNDWHRAKEPNRPRNAMYWAGYQICKAFYEQATDKQQAIYDILNCKDYKHLFEMSKADEYMAKTYK
jgi:Predicted Zn-dependent protease (DUF2268)